MLKKYARGFSIAGAVCFIAMAVLTGFDFLNSSFYYFSFTFDDIYKICSILLFFGYIVTATALIKGRKNILFPIGTALLAVANVLYIISNIVSDYYFASCFESISYFIYYFSWFLTHFGIIYIFIIALFTYLPNLSDKSKIMKKLWFIPVIILAVFTVAQLIVYAAYLPLYLNPLPLLLGGLNSVLYNILSIFAFWGLGLWIASDYEAYEPMKSGECDEYINDFSNAHFNLAGHILLLLLFGIWQYFWVYRTTKHLNADRSEEYRSPSKKLLLYIFVPFYSIYWVYMSCQRIDNLAKQRGLTSGISTLCVIFSVFMPFVAWIVMQSRINKICKISPIDVKSYCNNEKNDFEKLREYKSLLDDGIITQEDFDRKKQEIMN